MTSQDHYFTTEPRIASKPVPVRIELPGVDATLVSDTGVFSYGAIDRGTAVMLRTIPAPPGGALLDLGCGYGAIAVTVALRSPRAKVWAVDVNERALELTRRNAAELGLSSLSVCTPDEVPPDLRFAAVYSNPPVRIGKAALHELLTFWLDRLAGDGAAYLVVHRHLGSDSLAAWLGERGHEVRRLRSQGGYRVLQVQARP